MGRPAAMTHTSFAEYLAFEAASDVRHEYLDGDILAMSGGTPQHSELSAAVISELRNLLRGRPCHVFTSDLRVRVATTGLTTYPDVSVVCGDLEADPADR